MKPWNFGIQMIVLFIYLFFLFLPDQVEKLRGENSSLFKQFTDITQQYREADTSNRVLKSDVDAMRARVIYINE